MMIRAGKRSNIYNKLIIKVYNGVILFQGQFLYPASATPILGAAKDLLE